MPANPVKTDVACVVGGGVKNEKERSKKRRDVGKKKRIKGFLVVETFRVCSTKNVCECAAHRTAKVRVPLTSHKLMLLILCFYIYSPLPPYHSKGDYDRTSSTDSHRFQ